MKKVLFMIFAALAVTTLSAQNSFSEDRNVTNFDKVNFELDGKVVITTGNEYKVTLTGEQNYVYNVMTLVENGTLTLKTENLLNGKFAGEQVVVYITMPDVAGITVAGTGSVYVENPLVTDKLVARITGSGDIYLQEIYADKGSCRISGSGSLNVTSNGLIPKFKVRLTGSGSFNAPSVNVDKLSSSITGTGKCDCMNS
jgi:hypothetical protein